MNRSRIIVLVAAVVAAGLAALLVRSLLGGGTEKSKAAIAQPQIPMTEVLVAASDIPAGSALQPASVRWQPWPKTSAGDTLITHQKVQDIAVAVKGVVARTPLIAGQPLTTTNIVHSDAVGFMSAQLSPGMRAVAIKITAESGAGGFILPNDRVDILMTQQITKSPPNFSTKAILHDVRVLAIGTHDTQNKDEKTVSGGTATLELTPAQADTVQRAAAGGTISLALRALGDSGSNARHLASAQARDEDGGGIAIIRYGILHSGSASQVTNQNVAGE